MQPKESERNPRAEETEVGRKKEGKLRGKEKRRQEGERKEKGEKE
jgi:hypothetical protein